MARQPLGLLLIRLFVSGVFLLSGLLKVLDPARFLIDVRSFQLLPFSLAFATALVLPWVEIFAALALWWSRLAAGSALLLGLATTSFLGAIAIATSRGIDLDCGCFGDWLIFPNTATHFAFNAILLGACLIVLRNAPEKTHSPS